MAIKRIVAKGLGFAPGTVKWIVTHGFGLGAEVSAVPGYALGEDQLIYRADGSDRTYSSAGVDALIYAVAGGDRAYGAAGSDQLIYRADGGDRHP